MENIKVCVTCLSSDRGLVSLRSIKHIIEEIKLTEVKNYSGAICWECKNVIMKFFKFKSNVLKAQTMLYSNVKLKDMKSLSCLQVKVNNFYNYEYSFNNDPLTDYDNVPKMEIDIKAEVDEFTDSNLSDTEDNDAIKNNENVYVDTLNTKEKELNILKKDKIDFDKKFIKVVFTEEEMIKSREDKRNHYNLKKIPFKCDSCILGFTRKENYEQHLVKKHDELVGPIQCDVCEVRFTNEFAMTSHRRKHYTCFKCRLCKYSTSEQWVAWNHCRLKHDKDQLDKIHCGQCDAIFKTPGDLQEHVQTNHKIHCSECGVTFKGKDTLRKHKARIHAVKREFVCDICRKTFKTKTRLESHIVSHSGDIGTNLSYCRVCQVQYKNIYVYRNHLKNSANHSEKTYSCPECNKKFVSKGHWNRHYKFYHLQKSQYKCESCDKIYISPWRLKNHKQVHHGLSRSRDHNCNICGKKFFTVSSLRNHQLTHSEQRSYMCEDCGDTFKQRPALYTHSKLVHGDGRKKSSLETTERI